MALLLSILLAGCAAPEATPVAKSAAAPPPAAASPAAAPDKAAMIARAKALELPTQAEPPPGDPLEHEAAGYAKVMCSAVFVTGLDPDFAAENVGYFTAPYAMRAKLGQPVIDRVNKAVHVTLPNGVVRTAKFLGDQGCVALPIGKTDVEFRPVRIEKRLPDPATQPWPMGDVLPQDPFPAPIDAAKVQRAVDAAFARPAGMTAAMVVTWNGRIIAERYGEGITMHTPLESWSMGKSVTATLLGTLLRDGVYRLDQPAPIPEWQQPGDARAKIRIRDLLQMSSGLRIRAHLDPDFDPSGPYPEHIYMYTGCIDTFRYAASRPLQWPPGMIGRYRNTEVVLVNYLIRLAAEKQGGEYHAFPQRALFDPLGIRTMVIDTDPYGNFLAHGYVYGSARDWSRLGNLYLQDGRWNGRQFLPAEFVKFVRTLAPAWAADNNPIYGGFFWLNGNARFPGPRDLYYMAGIGGQYVVIIPSHGLVVVRMGHYKGADPGFEDFKRSLALLLEAVPRRAALHGQALPVRSNDAGGLAAFAKASARQTAVAAS